jgi:TetR/AcrR family transcriptional regulator, transcriptional repressor for nem operon
MRKSAKSTKTRLRIVETAAKKFRESGIINTSVAELMDAAGLTVGGFYRHFDSKEHLVAEACDYISQSALEMRKEALTQGGLKKFIDCYLSDQHRADRSEGFLYAALGNELARNDGDARAVATQDITKCLDLLTQAYRKLNPADARARALVTLPTLVGALMLSRITDDSQVSDALLRSSRAHLKSLAENRA